MTSTATHGSIVARAEVGSCRALLAATGRELFGLARWLESYEVAGLYLDTAHGQVTALFARTTGDYQAETMSVAEFMATMELGADFADDYHSIAVHRGPDARDGWASPDVAPLSVPLGEFLAEVDALLAAGESGQRSR